jgi:hypothetical protein
MGYLSMRLKEKIHPKARGIVRTDYLTDVDAFLKEKGKDYPIIMSDSFLISGFLPLSYPKSKQAFVTYLLLFD